MNFKFKTKLTLTLISLKVKKQIKSSNCHTCTESVL